MDARGRNVTLGAIAVGTALVACGERAPAPRAADTRAADTRAADTVSVVDMQQAPVPEPAAPSLPARDSTSAEAAADVVRRYYAAIAARDFRRAYELWGRDGGASGQTFASFEAGFARTARVEAEVGEPGRVEGAAGSRYVEVPVVVRAVTTDGERQRFEGSYTLRRTVVDGATPEERRWHLHAADVARTDRAPRGGAHATDSA